MVSRSEVDFGRTVATKSFLRLAVGIPSMLLHGREGDGAEGVQATTQGQGYIRTLRTLHRTVVDARHICTYGAAIRMADPDAGGI